MPIDTRSTVFKYRICISLEWDGHSTLGSNCCSHLLPAELHHWLAEGSPSTAGPKSNVSCLVTILEQDIQACSFPWLCARQSYTSGWTPFPPADWAGVPGLHSEVADFLGNSKSTFFLAFIFFSISSHGTKKLSFPSDGYGLAVTAQIHLICQEDKIFQLWATPKFFT